MVRLVFRPYTQLRRSICTSESRRTSTRVSPGFVLAGHRSPSFGSQRVRSRYIRPGRTEARPSRGRPGSAPPCTEHERILPQPTLRQTFAFTTPWGLNAPRLAHMLDSLVRVSRRECCFHILLAADYTLTIDEDLAGTKNPAAEDPPPRGQALQAAGNPFEFETPPPASSPLAPLRLARSDESNPNARASHSTTIGGQTYRYHPGALAKLTAARTASPTSLPTCTQFPGRKCQRTRKQPREAAHLPAPNRSQRPTKEAIRIPAVSTTSTEQHARHLAPIP